MKFGNYVFCVFEKRYYPERDKVERGCPHAWGDTRYDYSVEVQREVLDKKIFVQEENMYSMEDTRYALE